MRRTFSALALALVALVANLAAQTQITPTTTFAAETSNNTSTADTFTSQANGNLGATNISKVNLRTLLYPGATTQIYVHFMPWFGQTSHMNVGYNSNDPNQVHRQLDDMLSRGITGSIIDWYGPNKTFNNTTALLLMQEAETRNGQFTFAVTEDKGALQACANTSGCSVTQQLISDLTYAYNTFEGSPAYMRIDGRPVVFFFDVDRYSITWSTVAAGVPGNPLFVFFNSGGFTHSYSAGSFAWIVVNTSNPDDWGQSYLDRFYSTGLKYPAEHTYAATYKGFNDTLASWSANRVMNQNCGQTWLTTFNEIAKYYSSSNQLEFLQLATWNDYEEGSELESGIDNCVTISGSTSGNTLSWSITGLENTIDHYTPFISVDGVNLMPLSDVPTGTYSVDLSTYKFAPGNYTLYVKAVGKPSLKNQMSSAISFDIADQPPTASLTVTPASGTAPVTVTASMDGCTDPDGAVTSYAIDFGDGTVVNAYEASHTYKVAGTYVVKGTATDNAGLSSSSTATVTVKANLPPTVSLAVTPASGTAPVTVTATVSASDPDGTIASTSINFGDGIVVSGANSTHTYSAAGTYTVTATATDNAGLTASSTASVTVSAPATPYVVTVASPASGSTVNSPAHLVASTTSPYPVTGMKIYVDGVGVYTTSAATIDTNVTMAPGPHAVTVKAWNTSGAVASQKLSVTVADQPPVASLAVTPTSGTAPVTVTATVTASDPDGTIASTSVNFGDGTIINGASATHTYSTAGTYTLTATVADNAGLKTTATSTVTVATPVVSGVKVVSPVNGGTYSSPVHVVASATSTLPIIAMKVYVDGVAKYSVSAASLDTYVAMKTGTRKVTVQAWDSSGAVFKNSMSITVK